MNEQQQAAFAAYMRQHRPKPPGSKYHALHDFTDFAAATLKRPVLHWRDLSVADAQTVMKAAASK